MMPAGRFRRPIPAIAVHYPILQKPSIFARKLVLAQSAHTSGTVFFPPEAICLTDFAPIYGTKTAPWHTSSLTVEDSQTLCHDSAIGFHHPD